MGGAWALTLAASAMLLAGGTAFADKGGVPNGGRDDRPQPQGPPATTPPPAAQPDTKPTPPGQARRDASKPTPRGQSRRSAPTPRRRSSPPRGNPGAQTRENRGGGQPKTTICHHTGSATNPWVEITVANPSLTAHRRHGDLIPAPASGCPGDAPAAASAREEATGTPGGTADGTPPGGAPDAPAAPTELRDAPGGGAADGTTETVPASGVLGEEAQAAPAQQVLGATRTVADTSGDDAAGSDSSGGSLPFTGLQLALLLALGAAATLVGVALRRGSIHTA